MKIKVVVQTVLEFDSEEKLGSRPGESSGPYTPLSSGRDFTGKRLIGELSSDDDICGSDIRVGDELVFRDADYEECHLGTVISVTEEKR